MGKKGLPLNASYTKELLSICCEDVPNWNFIGRRCWELLIIPTICRCNLSQALAYLADLRRTYYIHSNTEVTIFSQETNCKILDPPHIPLVDKVNKILIREKNTSAQEIYQNIAGVAGVPKSCSPATCPLQTIGDIAESRGYYRHIYIWNIFFYVWDESAHQL